MPQPQQPDWQTVTTDEGYTFKPWTDGWAVGFEVTHPTTGKVEYVYLNPSGGSDMGEATVFLYHEDTPEREWSECYVDLFTDQPIPDPSTPDQPTT